jgi:hypothetical protein
MPDEFDFPKLHEPGDSSEKPEGLPKPAEAEPIPAQLPELEQPDADPAAALSKTTPISALKTWILNHKPVALVLGFVLVASAMWGINKMRSSPSEFEEKTQSGSPEEIPVNVVEVRMGRFQDKIEAVGTLKGEVERAGDCAFKRQRRPIKSSSRRNGIESNHQIV